MTKKAIAVYCRCIKTIDGRQYVYRHKKSYWVFSSFQGYFARVDGKQGEI